MLVGMTATTSVPTPRRAATSGRGRRSAPHRPVRPVLVLLLAILVAALAACSQPRFDLQEKQSFRDASRLQTVEAGVSPEVESLRLDLELEVEEGTVAFRVFDPTGAAVWQGEISSGGSLSDRRELQPIEGEWRLELALEDATGRYAARWLGR